MREAAAVPKENLEGLLLGAYEIYLPEAEAPKQQVLCEAAAGQKESLEGQRLVAQRLHLREAEAARRQVWSAAAAGQETQVRPATLCCPDAARTTQQGKQKAGKTQKHLTWRLVQESTQQKKQYQQQQQQQQRWRVK